MKKGKLARISTFVGILGVSAGLVGVAAQTTGAYFSDTKTGTITGTVGSIKVTGSGGSGTNGLDLQFVNLLPGEPQSVTATYQNTGTNNEDVWIVFNNADALHALNNLGTYGEAHLSANGNALFDSANLNDNLPPASGSCGAFSPAGCWPLMGKYKVASNVAPSGSGTTTFTFQYASKLTGSGGGVWNSYPLGAPSASGLPYSIVATQVGIAPA